MLSSAIETSRAWNAGLNRMGWGCVSTIAFIYALSLDQSISSNIGGESQVTLPSILSAILLFLSSGLLGSVAISVGSIGVSAKFDVRRRALIAEKVGRLKNENVSQLFNDASLRFELAAGFRGTLLLTAFAFFLFISASAPISDFKIGSPQHPLALVAAMLVAILLVWATRRVAIETFEAIEEIIDREINSMALE